MNKSKTLKTIIKKKLKIIALNVNSIVANYRRVNLTKFLEKHVPDIMLLSETKLNSRHVLEFQNYNLERTDREKAMATSGGTAILINNKYKYERINVQGLGFKNIEATVIKMKMRNENLFIISLYGVPKSRADESFDRELREMFELLELGKSENYFVIAGDMNARHTNWKSPRTNYRGERLKKWLDEESFIFKTKLLIPNEASFDRGNSYIDLALIDDRLNHHKDHLDTLEYESDHKAIMLKISKGRDKVLELFEVPTEYTLNYRKTNWENFRSGLKQVKERYKKKNGIQEETPIIPDNRNLDKEEIEKYLEDLNKLIKETIEWKVPKIKKKNSTECFLNEAIEKMQKEKSGVLTKIKKIKRKFTREQINSNPQLSRKLNELKGQMKCIRYLIEQNVKISVNDYWKKRIEGIRTTDQNMFPKLNRIFRKKQKACISELKVSQDKKMNLEDSHIDTTNLMKDSSGNFVINDPMSKLKLIGKSFEQVHKSPNIVESVRLKEIVERNMKTFKETVDKEEQTTVTITKFHENNRASKPNNRYNILVTQDYLQKLFRESNRKKSAGIDGIPNIVLRNLSDDVIAEYCTIFNNILNNMCFPQSWKISKTIPIKKPKKDGDNPENYRPISLLPNISKIFEKVINERIVDFCEEKNIIPDNQFGFRKEHGTVHAINKFVSDTLWHFQKDEVTGACLIDLKKAFDSVWLDGLIYKLLKFEFPPHLVRIIYNMINGRQFLINDGVTTLDTPFSIQNGLQQGTINSPVLFSIFISPLLKIEKLCSNRNYTLAFADDLIIYTSGKKIQNINEQLQNMFDVVRTFTSNWGIQINTEKCETILVRRPLHKEARNVKKNWKSFGIKNQGEAIKNVTSVRYLGIEIDNLLKYSTHVKNQLTKARNAFAELKSLFFSKQLEPKIKVLAYTAIIRPILTYGCPIWYSISPCYMEKLRIFERTCLRICLNKRYRIVNNVIKYYRNKEIYDEATVHRIDVQILRQTRKHILRSSQNRSNSLIFGPFYPMNEYYKKCISIGNVPPEAFTFLDREGYLFSEDFIPIVYHIPRKISDKTFHFNKESLPLAPMKYCTQSSNRDQVVLKREQDTKPYWWLE